MAGKVVDICTKHIVPIIENLGYDVLEVEYAKKVDGMNLTFFIDKEQGISIDDCEKVNNAISDKLDEINVTDDAPYILNVSSAGLDRPITTEKDFKRNKNKKVEIKLYTPINKKKVYEGLLIGFGDEGYTLKLENEEIITFTKATVANCIPVIEF